MEISLYYLTPLAGTHFKSFLVVNILWIYEQYKTQQVFEHSANVKLLKYESKNNKVRLR